MRCFNCCDIATDKHHIIYRSQGGANSPENLVYLCRNCHYLIHHGTNTKAREELVNKLYRAISPFLDKCWKGKMKPKIIRILENETK